MNQTRIYLNGEPADAPGSSINGSFTTASGGSFRIGANEDESAVATMIGELDEVRISPSHRGSAWAKFSYENQKLHSQYLNYDVTYISAPVLPSNLSLPAVKDVAVSYQIRSTPPATSYSITSGSLPSGIHLNQANGVISGTTTLSSGTFDITIEASNGAGTSTSTISVLVSDTVEAPSVSPGIVSRLGGRTVDIICELERDGGTGCNLTVYYGETDEGSTGTWDENTNLGLFNTGLISFTLENLHSGKEYFYKIKADNGETGWSETGEFTTASFDQGILRFHTGDDESGTGAGVFWDRQDGDGEQKIADAALSSTFFLAPDGSSWTVTKSKFSFAHNLLIGRNLNKILLQGVNALSLEVDGNVTIEKNLSGSSALTLPHVTGATTLDGHDAFYSDEETKGFRLGKGNLGGFSGGQGPGKGYSLGESGAGGISGGGGSHGGEGGPGASGPAGQNYGQANLDILLGGSGGGLGNLGEAAAGGGALEIVSSGVVTIDEDVRISMNGGTIFVNPTSGANFSGGSGSGGALRIVANDIINHGVLEVKGGDASGADNREAGTRFLSNSGGAGGGGRVALISDEITEQGTILLEGGASNVDGAAGQPGSLFIGPRSSSIMENLSLDDGNLLFDTGGSWIHSSGLRGKGVLTTTSTQIQGTQYQYTVCTFSFGDLELGPGLTVSVIGNNALQIDIDGNFSLASDLNLNGKTGSLGLYSGKAGPGGWASGRGVRNTELFSNLHPALDGQGPGGGRGHEIGRSAGGGSYGGSGTSGFNGGVPGITYGDESITDLLGGSGGGHTIMGAGNAGGGGGAVSIQATGNFTLQPNTIISVNGGNGTSHADGSGAGGSGGAIRIMAGSISNYGKLEAVGGDALGERTLAGAGGGGRIALLSNGTLIAGDTNTSGGQVYTSIEPTYRENDLIAYWPLDEASSSNEVSNVTGNTNLDGDIYGNPERRAGKKGGAFYFDGNDDHIIIPYSAELAVEKYSISLWYYPERSDLEFAQVLGRNDRNYWLTQGDSNHPTNPYLYHRYGVHSMSDEGVSEFPLSAWKKWYHVVISNSGLGGIARTYVNGSFTGTHQKFERRIDEELIINYADDLYIGTDPNTQSENFLGMMDDIRFYGTALGAEDVYHLYKLDPNTEGYLSAVGSDQNTTSGSVAIIQPPEVPSLNLPSLTFGTFIDDFSLDQGVRGTTYSITGLPKGLSSASEFNPTAIPGIFAWYAADRNNSFNFHTVVNYERNDSVAPEDLLIFTNFDDNGTIALDRSGNGNHGALIDQASWAPGKVGTALSFDGKNDALVFPKVKYMDQPEAFSIAFWFKRNSDNNGPENETNHEVNNLMVAQSSSYDNDNLEIGSEGTEIEIYLDSGDGIEDTTHKSSGLSIQNDLWYHLAVTYGQGLKVYLNGTNVPSLTKPELQGPLDSSQDSPLSLGMARIYSDQWGDFNGSIDDFRIYQKELNASEILSLHGNGYGDFMATPYQSTDGQLIKEWKDLSGNGRNAHAKYEQAPKILYDPLTSKKMARFDYGKSLTIPSAVTMPLTIFMVGREDGISFPDRELFTKDGWRLSDYNKWSLRNRLNNSPALVGTGSSTIQSLLCWTIDRYNYELRLNGSQINTSASEGWNPSAIFDRINGDTSLEIGELILFPRTLTFSEKTKIEGYLAYKWSLEGYLPENHPYESESPLGSTGLIFTGTPEEAGNFTITATATNLWGTVSEEVNLSIDATAPRIRTGLPRDVGSVSARVFANLLDTGGESTDVSYLWGTSQNSLTNETQAGSVSTAGETFGFISGLDPNTTYFYQAKAENSAGISNGNALSFQPNYHWELNDTGSVAFDQENRRNGQISDASSVIDGDKGNVLEFDGDNDYISFGDLDELDQIREFTVSLWFKRTLSSSSIPTNHNVHNILLAQSSDATNDNLEIGSFGSDIQIYIDSGTGVMDTAVQVDAGITDNQWYHLALVYGTELELFIDGTRLRTWTQYNGRLNNSFTSPLTIGVASPDQADPWGDFTGRVADFRFFLHALDQEEIKILSGQTSVQSFTTGDKVVPPIVVLGEVTNISDSNGTLHYELQSFDGAEPEIVFYWGTFDQKKNPGLWEHSHSLGQQGVGKGQLQVGGFAPATKIYYQVQAKGSPYDAWALDSGEFKTVSLSEVKAKPATEQTVNSVVLNGEILSNGGSSEIIELSIPLVSEDLYGHWRFDEGQGSETYDSTGQAPTAQIKSGVSWVSGLEGAYKTSLKFDGSSLAFIDLGGFPLHGALSFSVWAHKENFGTFQSIFDFGNGESADSIILNNKWTSNTAKFSILRESLEKKLEVQNFWKINHWQHIAATINSSGIMKLYADGVLLGTTNGHTPNELTRTNHFLGKSSSPGNDFYKGMMDDFRIYSRALEAEEVRQIYGGDLIIEKVLGGDNPTLYIYWGDEDAGETTEVNASNNNAWDYYEDIGESQVGIFSKTLNELDGHSQFFYRIMAENSAGKAWSPTAETFSTGDFSFRPDSFPKGELLLWLDAADTNGDQNYSNEPFGGFVEVWNDKSGNSHDARDGIGPRLQVKQWNELNTLKFDGNTQFLRIPNSNAFHLGEEATIFVVAQGHNSVNWAPIISRQGEEDGWQFRRTDTGYAAFTIRGTNDGWPDRPSGTTFNGDPRVWAMRKSVSRKTLWADGALEFEVAVGGTISSVSGDDVVIAAQDYNGIRRYASIEIGEIMVFDSALSNHEVQQMQGLLGHKWGLQENMPSTHPYFSVKPSFENRPQILLKTPYPLVKDQNIALSISTNRPAESFSSLNLPSGLSLEPTTGIITGAPDIVEQYNSVLQASNYAGSLSKDVVFVVNDFSGFPFSLNISFPGYTQSKTINNLPVYLELNRSIIDFSYEQFASPYGHDLRFLTADGAEELKYEVVDWDPEGTSSFWVLLPELNASTTIQAIWGNHSETKQPSYCRDGSVWEKYRGVWHMDSDDTELVRDSRASYHATPNNFQQLRANGLLGRALSFDGVDDYLDMALESHPPSETAQLTLSFWAYGKLENLQSATLLESSSPLGRFLNIDYPWEDTKFHWDVGTGSYDRIEKEDPNYRNNWTYWVLQKDADLGVMKIYRNGALFHEGVNKTSSIGGEATAFRIGLSTSGSRPWPGLLDELRMGLFIEEPDKIEAAYQSQRPDNISAFSAMSQVIGPPIILSGQLVEGYANDSNRVPSYFIQSFPHAESFSAVGLPAGLNLDAATGEISGIPLQGGTYQVTITAQNSHGIDQENINLSFADVQGFSHRLDFDFSGYTGGETLNDFPVFIKFNSSISKFSLKSFASSDLNDLRFYDNQGTELSYEIENIDPQFNQFSVWVQVPELNATNTISAYWGNPGYSSITPTYTVNGSTWSNDFRGVWHFRPMKETTTLTDSTYFRNHANDTTGVTLHDSILSSGRSFSGSSDQFIQIPASTSLDTLDQSSFTFTSWVNMENIPDGKKLNSFLGQGYHAKHDNIYYNDIELLKAFPPTGSRVFQSGPRQGLHLDNDTDFQNLNIGISERDNYMSLFLAYFKPPVDGYYQFRCDSPDDKFALWIDLDRNGVFAESGSNGEEKILVQLSYSNSSFYSDMIDLTGGVDYQIAIAHGEGNGGSRLKPYILTPEEDWRIIDPSDPSQDGYYSVTFDGSLSEELSSFSLFKHGSLERFDFRDNNLAMTHRLTSGAVNAYSTAAPSVDEWTYVAAQVNALSKEVKIFQNGQEIISENFSSALPPPLTGQDWFVGMGDIGFKIDEVTLSASARSADWIKAVYDNQKQNPSFPSISEGVNGNHSFISETEFTINAEQPFLNKVLATGSPSALIASGLPPGLILDPDPVDGNLSGYPSQAGFYEAKLFAFYPDGAQASQDFRFTVLSGSPEISISSPQTVTTNSLRVDYEVTATGGDDPELYIVADTVDHGKDLYKWQFRLELGKAGLGEGSTILAGLNADSVYYVRMYAVNSVGEDWTGKASEVRLQPQINHLPVNLSMWLDSTDILADGTEPIDGAPISVWKDKSLNERDMDNRKGDPLIKLEGPNGKAVVDFDGDDQIYSTYSFTDGNIIRNMGYSAFGVSRYTGGKNGRVISSVGHNWLMGHHWGRMSSYYLNGWITQGYGADTNFHLWEIHHEGRNAASNPSGSVWTDGIKMAENRNSAWWGFFPSKLSFGAFDSLAESSMCQVAEFLIFKGLIEENERLLIEGYLSHKWSISLPSEHPWAFEQPSFGEIVSEGATPVGITSQTLAPIIVNRKPVNQTNTSASLTGQVVSAGLGLVEDAPFSPSSYSGLRLWLDASDADGNGIPGSDFHDAASSDNVVPWTPSFIESDLWLDANDSSTLSNLGWSVQNLTGDTDSFISSANNYTSAINVNGGDVNINGVTFLGQTSATASGWEIMEGLSSTFGSHTRANVEGALNTLLNSGFLFGGDPQKIKLTGLTDGETYTFSLYSSAWGSSSRTCVLSCSDTAETVTVDQDGFHDASYNGLLVECTYIADGTEVTFTIDPTAAATWHLYAFSNRIESNLDVVTKWNDKSGKGKAAVQQLSISRPSRLGSLSSLPAVRFDGIDDFLDLPLSASLSDTYSGFFCHRSKFGYQYSMGRGVIQRLGQESHLTHLSQ